MNRFVHLAGTSLLAVSIASATPAASFAQDARDVLARQAQSLHERGQENLAVNAWLKLLSSHPDDAEALFALGRHEASAGRTKTAKDYLERLRRVDPSSPRLAELERAVAVGKVDEADVSEARRLAAAGQPEKAVAAYRRAFAGDVPSTAHALEFYQTLGGTEAGWAAAEKGLRGLADGSNEARLALARHLTYREPTRREGMRMLASLAEAPATREAASADWRDALLWLAAKRDDITLYKAYLDRAGPDAEISAKLDAIGKPAPLDARGKAIETAWAALREGRTAQAEKGFAALAAADPDDMDAVGGLGVAALRRGAHAEAAKHLERAAAADPARWAQPLAAARRSAAVAQGRAAAAKGDFARAEDAFRRASAAGAEPYVTAALADTLARQGKDAAAEAAFRDALRRDPRDAGSARGLVDLLLKRGDFAGAVKAAEDSAAARGDARGRAERWRAIALSAEARGATAEADAAWSRGIAEDERDFELRIRRARLLARTGGKAVAAKAIAELVARNDADGSALREAARLYAELGMDAQAAATLARGGEAARRADAQGYDALKRLVDARLAVSQAIAADGAKRGAEARAILAAAEPQAGSDPAALVEIGMGWAEIGETERASLAVAGLRTAALPAAVAIRRAAVLMRAGKPAESAEALDAVEAHGRLLPEERDGLAAMRSGLAVKSADQARLGGDFAGAWDALAARLAERPNDPATLAAMGRLHQAAGKPKQALAHFRKAVEAAPGDPSARNGAVGAAIAAGETKLAVALAEEGARRAPDDPRVRLTAARAYKANGDLAKASADLKRAEAALGGRSGAAASVDGNPYRAARAAEAFNGATLKGALDAGEGDRAAAVALAAEIERDRAQLRPSLTVAPTYHARSGVSGLGKTDEAAVDVKYAFRVGDGMATLAARPTTLSAGKLDGSPEASREFGTNALGARDVDPSATGIGLSAGFDWKGFSVDLGTKPLGFEGKGLVGGLSWSHAADSRWSFKLSGSRRAVTDSVLSHAGLRDPNSGLSWGGVSKTEGRAEVGYDDGDFGFYVAGSMGAYEGDRVKSNVGRQFDAGAFIRPVRGEAGSLKVGVNATSMAFDRNQRHYSLGHGGYFSPQSFLALSVPAEWNGTTEDGRLTYRIGGSVGMNFGREASAAVFPNDPGLQSALAATGGNLAYEAKSLNGVAYGLGASAEYKLRPDVAIGGRLSFDRGEQFSDAAAMVYLRKAFD